MRTAYEDNAGGLMIVDDVKRQVAWGAEYTTHVNKENDILACLKSDLSDWGSYADDNGNNHGDKNENMSSELTYKDYVKDTEHPSTEIIAHMDNEGVITIYPEVAGNNGHRWIFGSVE